MRNILDDDHIDPAIRDTIAGSGAAIIAEVKAAVAANRIVIVGMAQNPYPKKARSLLESRGIAFHYLEYGSYVSMWRQRLSLKQWTGWTTFPMVFVDGTFIGGAAELKKLVDAGRLQSLLPA